MKKQLWIIFILTLTSSLMAEEFQIISFPSKDDLTVTADLYLAHDKNAPFILLFHQARSSRGEYRVIAPELNRLGFNAMAVDQRSGNIMDGVNNETAKRARAQNKSMTYLDALPDMEASMTFVRRHYAKGRLLLWGSSYSASLVLKIAGDQPRSADAVLAFSPGEYFSDLGKDSRFISSSAAKIQIPVFFTSAREEGGYSIYSAIPTNSKIRFLPKGRGVHGSRALWGNYPDHEEYWKAVEDFLSRFLD